jgi:phage-related protein
MIQSRIPSASVVVVRAFVKKTQKTPSREFELTLRRAQEIQP